MPPWGILFFMICEQKNFPEVTCQQISMVDKGSRMQSLWNWLVSWSCTDSYISLKLEKESRIFWNWKYAQGHITTYRFAIVNEVEKLFSKLHSCTVTETPFASNDAKYFLHKKLY
ncbi:uncharacterized protein LOC128041907 [Gossypium raimondii]|uniref:uncharacterized protein LOC128041907 n=1 Tax=Gossypium raimondii TaxID=29730 RepID=UPI00227AC438|nr:uncharacterized protein LOC128041907 [Gossypium raimondii]